LVISPADYYTTKTQYRNLAIVSIFSHLWRLEPTFFQLIFFKISLSGEISPAHGYITKTQYRNLAIFSNFLNYGDWNQLFSILFYF
jgi:hypothetical protein